MTKRVILIAGTRPEVIKLAPLYRVLKSIPLFSTSFCAVEQHDSLLKQALETFDLVPDFFLAHDRGNDGLEGFVASTLFRVFRLLREIEASFAIVQGDTATSAMGAYAAYLAHVALGHVEAGLRTRDIWQPWPEEGHRRLISTLSRVHFAATRDAAQNLLNEQVDPESILITGNTGIDALHFVLGRSQASIASAETTNILEALGTRKLVLVSFHRRETLLAGAQGIVSAIRRIALRPDVLIVLQVHPNPGVVEATEALTGLDNIILVSPRSYQDFIFLMSRSYFIMSDSGGVQEEAPCIGKPVLILRDKTERMEAVFANASRLVGTEAERIVRFADQLLDDDQVYKGMAIRRDIYGDGTASKKIAEEVLRLLQH